MESFDLVKEVRGLNTYKKAIDTGFSELVSPAPTVNVSAVTVSDFFTYYDQLFFDIPVSGSTNSHMYLVQRSQQYIGGNTVDIEKQALIEEINSLRQQLVSLSETYLNISEIS